jgi:hypothetical protein
MTDTTDEAIPNLRWRSRGRTATDARAAKLERDRAKRLECREIINARHREAYRAKRLLEGKSYTPRLDWRRT